MFCNEVSSAGTLRTTGVAGYPRCRPGAVCPSSNTTMSGKSGDLLCDVVHLSRKDHSAEELSRKIAIQLPGAEMI
jgi:hypothetical protein